MTTEVLNRQTFTVSRESEFFNERSLTVQIGLPTAYWLQMIIKELLDNSLDACEESGILPEIIVSVDGDNRDVITVQDNGNGITPEVITKILDFTSTTSDKAAYASPTRGSQGNALKTILAIPYVLSEGKKDSRVVIESQGIRHGECYLYIWFAIGFIRS
jgi:DNA topoisomerase VI subunit B